MDPRPANASPPIGGPDGDDAPMLTIDGLERSVLKLMATGLQVCPSPAARGGIARFWAYDDLAEIRVTEYGGIGMIHATLRREQTDLPLLLVELEQITSARRTLEHVWSRVGVRTLGRPAA